MLHAGNSAVGGLIRIGVYAGIVGLVRFLHGQHIILICRSSTVALVGGHCIKHIDETTTYSISPLEKPMQNEMRYLHIFGLIDLNKNFYFSYSYDITR